MSQHENIPFKERSQGFDNNLCQQQHDTWRSSVQQLDKHLSSPVKDHQLIPTQKATGSKKMHFGGSNGELSQKFSVASTVKSNTGGHSSILGRYNFRQLITSPSEIVNELANTAKLQNNNIPIPTREKEKENVKPPPVPNFAEGPAVYLKTDDSVEQYSRQHLLKLNQDSSESLIQQQLRQQCQNINQASKDSFGIYDDGALRESSQSVVLNLSYLSGGIGQYLKENDAQSSSLQAVKISTENNQGIRPYEMVMKQPDLISKGSKTGGFNQVLNSDLSQYIVPSFDEIKHDEYKNASGAIETKQSISNDQSRHFSFSEQKFHNASKSECFEDQQKFSLQHQTKSAQETQQFYSSQNIFPLQKQQTFIEQSNQITETASATAISNIYYQTAPKSVTQIQDSKKQMNCSRRNDQKNDSITEKIQILRDDISNLFPPASQRDQEKIPRRNSTSQDKCVKINDMMGSLKQQRVNAKFQSLIKQATNHEDALQNSQCEEEDARRGFLSFYGDESFKEKLCQEILIRTEDRIRRSRAERSQEKQKANYNQTSFDINQSSQINGGSTNYRDCSTQDEIAYLKKEVRYLASKLKEDHSNYSSRHHQCCTASSRSTQQEEEIKSLKKDISSFEDRFKSEVQNIQQHYKAYYREWKNKKTGQMLELQAKLEAAEKQNFNLEVQIKELKLKLEYRESNSRKSSELSFDRKYELKLDELRNQYEKLLRNVRIEEREKFKSEQEKQIENNLRLQAENESLKLQIQGLYAASFGKKENYTEYSNLQQQNRIKERRSSRKRIEERSRSKKLSTSPNSRSQGRSTERKVSKKPNSKRAISHSNLEILKGEASIGAYTPKSLGKASIRSVGLRFNPTKSTSKLSCQVKHSCFLKQSASKSTKSPQNAHRQIYRTTTCRDLGIDTFDRELPQQRTSRFNEALFTDSSQRY